MFEAQILVDGACKEYLSCALKFRTFGNMSQKLWPTILLSFHKWVVRENRKKSLFLKKKIEIIPFLSMNQKL